MDGSDHLNELIGGDYYNNYIPIQLYVYCTLTNTPYHVVPLPRVKKFWDYNSRDRGVYVLTEDQYRKIKSIDELADRVNSIIGKSKRPDPNVLFGILHEVVQVLEFNLPEPLQRLQIDS